LPHRWLHKMGFLSVCTALYDYQPQADGELEIKEGELLYILEKDSGDDWWKAKKRAAAEEDDEPVGLIPNNYVEPVSVPRSSEILFPYFWNSSICDNFLFERRFHIGPELRWISSDT
jgi:hypothetical protein